MDWNSIMQMENPHEALKAIAKKIDTENLSIQEMEDRITEYLALHNIELYQMAYYPNGGLVMEPNDVLTQEYEVKLGVSPFEEGTMNFSDSFEGAILGAVIGDALGVPAEFMSREELRKCPVRDMIGGGAHNQPAGTWSDDTSMILCTMDSMIANQKKGIDYDDQMQRFSDWLWNAENTAHDEVFDVGGTTKHAIFKYVKKTPALECGETAENTCGNGSLMRIMPTALYIGLHYDNEKLDDRAADIIHNTSKCTHAHPKCQVACGIYCAVVFRLLDGGDLKEAVYEGIESALEYYRSKPEYVAVLPEFEMLREIGEWAEDDIKSGGYVIRTLQAALWCLLNTKDFSQCVLKAVNLGRDTDTTAAVAGGLAGLWYGSPQIPPEWEQKTAKYEEIKKRVAPFYRACLRVTREEGRAIEAKCREAGERFLEYLEENNIQLLKPCPAPKLRDWEKEEK